MQNWSLIDDADERAREEHEEYLAGQFENIEDDELERLLAKTRYSIDAPEHREELSERTDA